MRGKRLLIVWLVAFLGIAGVPSWAHALSVAFGPFDAKFRDFFALQDTITGTIFTNTLSPTTGLPALGAAFGAGHPIELWGVGHSTNGPLDNPGINRGTAAGTEEVTFMYHGLRLASISGPSITGKFDLAFIAPGFGSTPQGLEIYHGTGVGVFPSGTHNYDNGTNTPPASANSGPGGRGGGAGSAVYRAATDGTLIVSAKWDPLDGSSPVVMTGNLNPGTKGGGIDQTFLSVIGGTLGGPTPPTLNTDTIVHGGIIPVVSDMTIQATLTAPVPLDDTSKNPSLAGWTGRSNDPVDGFVPEPMSLLLLGGGLIGLAGVARLQRKQR